MMKGAGELVTGGGEGLDFLPGTVGCLEFLPGTVGGLEFLSGTVGGLEFLPGTWRGWSWRTDEPARSR